MEIASKCAGTASQNIGGETTDWWIGYDVPPGGQRWRQRSWMLSITCPSPSGHSRGT